MLVSNVIMCPFLISKMLGVAHKIPVRAMVHAKESYDPSICSPLDDTVEKVEEGTTVVLLRDWTKPPKHLQCNCQKQGELCKCGHGAKPTGMSLNLTWDKTKDTNR